MKRRIPLVALLAFLLGPGPPGTLSGEGSGSPGLRGAAAEAAVEGAPAGEPAPPRSESRPDQESEAAVQVPPSLTEVDRRVEEELNAVFQRIRGLESVRATVEAGVVVLSGTVLSQEDRALAEKLASGREGVLHVQNRVQQVASLRSRLGSVAEEARERLLDFLAYFPLLAVALLILAAFALLARWAGRWRRLYERLTPNAFAQNALRQVTRGAIVLAGLLLALQLLEVTALVGAVLGAAGIFGLAIGFAFRAVAENYLAGVFLSLRHPFAPNDHILLGGHEGKVVRLTARETILLTLDGNHLRIPNATVFNSVILNYTRNPRRRFEFSVSVGESEDLVRAQAEGIAALGEMEGLLREPPPAARVRELGDGIVTLQFFGWVDQRRADFRKVRSEAIRLVKTRLDAAAISMPPTAYLVQMARLPGERAAEPDLRRPPAVPEAAGPAGEPRRPGAGAEAEVTDISVDHALDEQIEEERRTSQEEDLLESPEPG